MEGDEGNAREASAVNPRSEEGGACGDFDDVDDVGCSSETVEGSSARESGEIEDLCPAERRLRKPDVSDGMTGDAIGAGFVELSAPVTLSSTRRDVDFLAAARPIVRKPSRGSSDFECIPIVLVTPVSEFRVKVRELSTAPSLSHALVIDDMDDCDNLTEVLVDVEGEADDVDSVSNSCCTNSPKPDMNLPFSRSPILPMTLAGRPTLLLGAALVVFSRVCFGQEESLLLEPT